MNMRTLMLTHTCAHACIVAHMDLYIMAYSHTQVHTCSTFRYVVYNKDAWYGTHTHKYCDMHMHSIHLLNCCCAFLYRPLI